MANRTPSKAGSQRVGGGKAGGGKSGGGGGKGGGKDRRARLEELKRQQRRAERRKTMLAIVSGLVVGAILIAIPVISSIRSSAEKKRKAAVGYVTTPSADAKAANCTGVRNDRTSAGHTPNRVNYDTAPPSSGQHNDNPLPDSIHFYTRAEKPSPERAVHLLEHGFVIGWYDAKLPADQVDKLKAASANAGDRFVAVPWDRADFGDNRHFALTAWGRTQRCGSVSQKVIASFVDTYTNVTAPEAGAGGGTPPGATVPVQPSAPARPTPSASPS